MQTKDELEKWYSVSDRWGYFHEPDDTIRLKNILMMLDTYESCIDIGCGEGFITTHLPSKVIYGMDISENAMGRLPENVISVDQPNGKHDLVISTGTLYEQYNHKQIYDWIISCAQHHILIAGIKEWIKPYDFGEKIKEVEFKYRDYTQQITLYKWF
jgi:2-polyprenyl-3-methyl-5-hydroxy-6-metoxy-1,4-benzoquinol methylase